MLPERDLMQHQIDGLQWMLERDHHALFMEMRLGKTLTYIRWAKLQPDVRKILIVAPVTVLTSWARELEAEGELFYTSYMEKGSTARLKSATQPFEHEEDFPGITTREWVLMNYEALTSFPQIGNFDWDAVCLDESTKIKTPTAKITKYCVTHFRDCPHRCILSGLPAPESTLELATQFIFAYGSVMGSITYWNFRNRHFVKNMEGKWVPAPGSDVKEWMHSNAFVRRRVDCHVGSKKLYQTKDIYLEKNEAEFYENVEMNFEFAIEMGNVTGFNNLNDAPAAVRRALQDTLDWMNARELSMETQWRIVLQTWLRRLAGGNYPYGIGQFHSEKVKYLLELLTSDLNGEQVVVWFAFNDELEQVEKMLTEAGITCKGIMGSTPIEERNERIHSFRNKGFQVMLGQIKCAKYGIDCSSADTAIYFSNDYSMEGRSQSEDRIVHPKKDTPQLIIDLITHNTVDQDVMSALRNKAANADMLMSRITDHLRTRRNSYV